MQANFSCRRLESAGGPARSRLPCGMALWERSGGRLA